MRLVGVRHGTPRGGWDDGPALIFGKSVWVLRDGSTYLASDVYSLKTQVGEQVPFKQVPFIRWIQTRPEGSPMPTVASSRNICPVPSRKRRDASGAFMPAPSSRRARLAASGFGLILALGGCVGDVGVGEPGGNGGTGSVIGTGGSGVGNGGRGTGSGGSVIPGSGGSIGGGGSGQTGTGGAVVVQCSGIAPGKAVLRRLTTYEYNNTLRDLLGDTTNAGFTLPPQIDSPDELHVFGNDAETQTASLQLLEKYVSIAQGAGSRATASSAALGKLHTCAAGTVAAANEESCARMIATALAPRAYRRTMTTPEVDELVSLYRSVRGLSGGTFVSGVAAMIEAMVQAPDFLFRTETGMAVTGNTAIKRIGGREMATRLSYLFWQTMPDAATFQAADMGMLNTNDGVLAQAKKMLEDPKVRPTVAFFFDNLLPIPDLNALTRDAATFPTYTSAIGVAMRNEVQKLLEHEIFDNTTQAAPPYVAGSWAAILTAPYTFVNQDLLKYYGASSFAPGTSVTGTALQKVNLNTTQRLGLITSAGFMAGTTTSNLTNPVLRGAYVAKKLMCRHIDPPPPAIAAVIKPPEPYTGKTTRERYGKHSAAPLCAMCHQYMDPVGLVFENYDAVGLYRTTEHAVIDNVAYDTPIDPSGALPGVGAASNAIELVKLIAQTDEAENCFAQHWMRFGHGRSIELVTATGTQGADACDAQALQAAFKKGGFNIKQFLLALTQSDGFLYRRAQ